MVTAEESQTCQQFSGWNSGDLNQMAVLQQLEQRCSLPYFIPSTLTANLAAANPGFSTEQPNAVAGKNFQHGLGVSDKPIDASCAPGTGKRFLIFDRSGNHTRMFVGPSFSRSATASEKVVSGVDEQFLVNPAVEEKWDENNLSDGEGEMVEDTEEINALLYSDSDDEYDDDDTYDGENYEITSTRHTLFGIEDCGKLVEQVMEEVASSDGSPKRRKLLDGSCKKSSFSCNYKDLSKKVKIHEAVNILGSIIPGLNSKDPLSIIEKAIVYLERMKMEAKALGSTAFP